MQANGAIFLSDRKFKKDIQEIDNALNVINQLDGKTYYWKQGEFKNHDFNSKKQSGFIAQEVSQVIPEIVHKDNNGEQGIDYIAIIPYLVESVKELSQDVKALKTELSVLKLQNKSNQISKLNDLKIYPNPASNYLAIEADMLRHTNAEVSIYNTSGKIVNSQVIQKGTSRGSISVSSLQKGVYIYKVNINGMVETGQFYKN